MNAYELAEKWELSLDVWDDRDYTSWCYDASSMLREQADRIAKLESELQYYKIRDSSNRKIIKELDEKIQDY